MMLRHSYPFLFVVFVIMCVSPAHAQENLLAFPTAEGYGKFAKGGRGGSVTEVTTLKCSGPGSFREAVEASGPRTVVFRTGGTIDCSSEDIIWLDNPYLTIAGHTAPGDGILLKGTGVGVRTHDVIIRHMRMRLGADFITTNRQHPDSAGTLHLIGTSQNVIVDHTSISWGMDDTFQIWDDATDITVQWSIIAEGIHCGTKSKCQSKGMLQGYQDTARVTIHHNLFANTFDRNPYLQTGLVDLINNVHHNVGSNSTHLHPYWAPLKANIVANYFSIGPSTMPYAPIRLIGQNQSPNLPGSLAYIKGNIQPVHRPKDSLPELDAVMFTDGPPHFPTTTTRITTMTYPSETNAFQAYTDVLANVGDNKRFNADGSFTKRRGVVDTRIVNEVKKGTGKIVLNTPDEVGGYPILSRGTPYADTDHDGMSDMWEERYGFDKTDATDRKHDPDGDGYTNLEEFLNGTTPGPVNDPPPKAPQNVKIYIN